MASTIGAGPVSTNDGSDLQELIAKPPRGGTPDVNFEIDSGGPGTRPIDFISDAVRLCDHQFPCLCRSLATLSALALLSLLSYALTPYPETGVFGGDYSAIDLAYGLNLSRVDHWCISGDDDSCTCEDPLEASSRSESKQWNAAHRANVADVELYRAAHGEGPATVDGAGGGPRPPIDVAFVGESVVEAMDGRWLGKKVSAAEGNGGGESEGPEARSGPDIGLIFERLFRKESGGPVEGVTLGIAGDNTANVLWRLQHGEMPADFNPKVWWIVLGMNDLTRTQCSEEIVVIGILRVVEEIRLRKPDAHIVINSLLPMVDFQLMEGRPHMEDFADFRREKEVRESMEMHRAGEDFQGKSYARARSEEPTEPEERGPHRIRRLRRHKERHRHRLRSDDDEAEGEDLREALERRKKELDARDKRARDKMFRDDESYRPNGPLPLFLPGQWHHMLPPVWPAVHLVNEKLKEFCKNHDSVSFFDATPIFASDEGGGWHRFRGELISPRGHPSDIGFMHWEARVVERLWKLLPPPDSATHGGDGDVDVDDEHEDGGRGVRRRMEMAFMR